MDARPARRTDPRGAAAQAGVRLAAERSVHRGESLAAPWDVGRRAWRSLVRAEDLEAVRPATAAAVRTKPDPGAAGPREWDERAEELAVRER
jgi:hypothetical protein